MAYTRSLCAMYIVMVLGGRAASAQPPQRGETPHTERDDTSCLNDPVVIRRAHSRPLEEASLALTHCDGRANLEVLIELSLLGRPNRMERPAAESVRTSIADDGLVAPDVIALDPGLLLRLQRVAERFPERALEIVSGHRPRSRRTSRHHRGRALDIRVVDVENLEVAEFARANLEATGVGYYPNSTHTHIDVREESHAWMDLSGPGQRARYRPWPAPEEAAPVEEPPATVASAPPPPPPPPAVDAEVDWDVPFESDG